MDIDFLRPAWCGLRGAVNKLVDGARQARRFGLRSVAGRLGRRVRIAGVCLGGLIAVAVVVALLLGGDDGDRAPDLGRFAGYVWSGSITGVQGSWAVPAIARRSNNGEGSTWIAAQGPGSSVHYPFIQVGVEESRSTDPTLGPRSSYNAYWSDTNHGFRAVTLFPVDAGDHITARLERQHDRWLVTVADATSHAHRRVITADQGDANLNTAEWIQEDTAANPSGTKALPYPTMAPVRFRQLSVNSQAPRSANLYSEWMSLPGTDLAPTALSGDAFTVTHALLSRAAARFIELASREDTAMTQFEQRSHGWTPATPRAVVAGAVAPFVTVLRTNHHALASNDWPPAAQAPVNALAHLVAAIITQVNASPSLTAPERASRLSTFNATGRRGAGLAREIRRALHAPDINPEPPT